MEAIEQLIKQSSLLQLRAKMEKKYKEAPEILDLCYMTVGAVVEMDEEGKLAPNMPKAISCMSMAACSGMKEAKRIMQELEHIVICSEEKLAYKFSEETIKTVDRFEEDLKQQIEKAIEQAEQEDKKTLKSFIHDSRFGGSEEIFLNYPYPSRLSDKSLRPFLLASALCEYSDEETKKEEFETRLLMLERSIDICLNSEKPWALDLMCFNLLYEANLCHVVKETDLEYFVLQKLYSIMQGTYYAKMIPIPYSLTLYMGEEEWNDQNNKMIFMAQVFKKLYHCVRKNEVSSEQKKELLSILSDDLHNIVTWGLNAKDGYLSYQYLNLIGKEIEEDDSLYQLLMYDDSTEEVAEGKLDNIVDGLYDKLVNLECLKSKNEPYSVFNWTRYEHDGFHAALKILEKGVPYYLEEENTYFKAMAKGLNTVYAVRCNTRSSKERLDELKVIANELKRDSLFDLLAFAHFVYYNNQGNLKFASSGALDILKNAGITDSKIAAALENGLLMV